MHWTALLSSLLRVLEQEAAVFGCCREDLQSKLEHLEIELSASKTEAIEAHTNWAAAQGSMSDQQTALQQVQADLETAAAARWV